MWSIKLQVIKSGQWRSVNTAHKSINRRLGFSYGNSQKIVQYRDLVNHCQSVLVGCCVRLKIHTEVHCLIPQKYWLAHHLPWFQCRGQFSTTTRHSWRAASSNSEDAAVDTGFVSSIGRGFPKMLELDRKISLKSRLPGLSQLVYAFNNFFRAYLSTALSCVPLEEYRVLLAMQTYNIINSSQSDESDARKLGIKPIDALNALSVLARRPNGSGLLHVAFATKLYDDLTISPSQSATHETKGLGVAYSGLSNADLFAAAECLIRTLTHSGASQAAWEKIVQFNESKLFSTNELLALTELLISGYCCERKDNCLEEMLKSFPTAIQISDSPNGKLLLTKSSQNRICRVLMQYFSQHGQVNKCWTRLSHWLSSSPDFLDTVTLASIKAELIQQSLAYGNVEAANDIHFICKDEAKSGPITTEISDTLFVRQIFSKLCVNQSHRTISPLALARVLGDWLEGDRLGQLLDTLDPSTSSLTVLMKILDNLAQNVHNNNAVRRFMERLYVWSIQERNDDCKRNDKFPYRTWLILMNNRMTMGNLVGVVDMYLKLAQYNREITTEKPILNRLIVNLCTVYDTAESDNNSYGDVVTTSTILLNKKDEVYSIILLILNDLKAVPFSLQSDTVKALVYLHITRGDTDDLHDLLQSYIYALSCSERREIIISVPRDGLSHTNEMENSQPLWDLFEFFRDRHIFLATDLSRSFRTMAFKSFINNFLLHGQVDLAVQVFKYYRENCANYNPFYESLTTKKSVIQNSEAELSSTSMYTDIIEGIAHARNLDALTLVHNLLKVDLNLFGDNGKTSSLALPTSLINSLMHAYNQCSQPLTTIELWYKVLLTSTDSPFIYEGPDFTSIRLILEACVLLSQLDPAIDCNVSKVDSFRPSTISSPLDIARDTWHTLTDLNVSIPRYVVDEYLSVLATNHALSEVTNILSTLYMKFGHEIDRNLIAMIFNALPTAEIRLEFVDWLANYQLYSKSSEQKSGNFNINQAQLRFLRRATRRNILTANLFQRIS